MEIQKALTTTIKAMETAAHSITRFAKLERVLASICLLIPLGLIAFDNWQIRESISAYYSMEENQLFYFPLTVASMLFLVNGVIKHGHLYNIVLGMMLAGVILFNHQDSSTVHYICAIAFFAGNGIVILLFSSKRELWFKSILVAIIAMSMMGYFFFEWFTLFWAEWISFGIIAFHYILESWGIVD